MKNLTTGTTATYVTNTQSVSVVAPPVGSPTCNPPSTPPTDYIIIPPPQLGGGDGGGPCGPDGGLIWGDACEQSN